MNFKPFNSYWWKDFYYTQISSRLRPGQGWLTRKIPKTWVDKDVLFEIVILESVKHHVEKDYGLGFEPEDYEKSQANPEYPEHQKQFDREIKANYELITQKLPELQKELDAAWDKIPHFDLDDINSRAAGDYEKIYGDVNRLEKEIDDIRTSIMLWAVRNRGSLWT